MNLNELEAKARAAMPIRTFSLDGDNRRFIYLEQNEALELIAALREARLIMEVAKRCENTKAPCKPCADSARDWLKTFGGEE